MQVLFTKNVCENKRIGSHWGRGPIGGCGPPMQALFTKNVCENKRIGSHRGVCSGHAPPRSANDYALTLGRVLFLSNFCGGTLNNAYFVKNEANFGGAILVTSSVTNIMNEAVFDSNVALVDINLGDEVVPGGGAIYVNFYSDIIISESQFNKNSAHPSGYGEHQHILK